MDPLEDVAIEHGSAPTEPPVSRPQGSPKLFAVLAIAFVITALAVAFFVWRRGSTPGAGTAGEAADAANAGAPATAVRATPAPTNLPPLELTDPLVRELVGALSSSPTVAAWLASDGLIRNFVVSVDNVSTGITPARHVSRLAPGAPFSIAARGETLVIDPASYARYDALADAVASLDPTALADLYVRLEPRLDEAYHELGYPDTPFRSAVDRAIVLLLSTPVPAGAITLDDQSVSYRFADETLETLAPAQKQLLRMGPRNASRIQSQLWAIGRAMGIPAERLPRPR